MLKKPYIKNNTSSRLVIVLAAGNSSRFGKKNKLTASFPNGLTVAYRTLQNIKKSGIQQVWFIRFGNFVLMKILRKHKVRYYITKNAQEGLSSTLKYAMRKTDHRAQQTRLITLADKPFISFQSYQKFFTLKLRKKIAIPPLVGCHPVLLKRSLKSKINLLKGDSGAHKLLYASDNSIFFVPLRDLNLKKDINYPEDLKK